MEEEQTEIKKDDIQYDAWEKLLKLTKRNNQSFQHQDSTENQLGEEDTRSQPSFWWSSSHIEKDIQSFWGTINQFYFQNVSEEDLSVFNELKEQGKLSNKDLIVKYADIPSYEAFKSIISDSYKNQYEEQTLNKSNIKNLQKYYRISAHHLLNKSCKIDSFLKEYNKTLKENSNMKEKKFFEKESECLNKFLDKKKPEKKDDDTDSISAELEELYEEKASLYEENKHLVSSLSKKVKNCPESLKNTEKRSLQKLKSNLIMTDLGKESRNVEVEYLEKVILRLEKAQTAESLKCIIDARKCTEGIESGEYEFCVLFDQAISTESIWITEANLKELNQARNKDSLWKVYDIPQKTRRSMYSPNIMGMQYCETVIANKKVRQQDRNQDWESLMKNQMNVALSEPLKVKLMEKLENFGFCHHCRHLFPDEILVKCNYRSSSMGFPYVDCESGKRKAFKEKLQETFHQIELGDRRSRYLYYQRQNGEVVCDRRFCQNCLRQTYGLSHSDFVNNPDFVCPFCKEDCVCSRCTRNDHIDKLRTIFVTLGGEIENINYKSYLEKFLLQRDERFEEILKKKFAQKVAKNAKNIPLDKMDIKARVDKYKNDLHIFKTLKELRVNMEKARMICAQLTRREMLKAQLDMKDDEMFAFERNELIELVGQKRKLEDVVVNKKEEKVEPNVSKMRKTVTKLVKIEQKSDSSDEDEVSSPENSVKEENIPVVRKRGRPRKIVPTAATSNTLPAPTTTNKNKDKDNIKEELKKHIERKLFKKKELDDCGLVIRIPDCKMNGEVKKAPGRPRKIDQTEKILGTTAVKQQFMKKKQLDVLLKLKVKKALNQEISKKKIKARKYVEESSESESSESESEESEVEEIRPRKTKVVKSVGRKFIKGEKSRSSTSSSKEIRSKKNRN